MFVTEISNSKVNIRKQQKFPRIKGKLSMINTFKQMQINVQTRFFL